MTEAPETGERKLEWIQLEHLFLGQAVLIRRTSGAEQKATVRAKRPGDVLYVAPEVPTFQVEWVGEDGKCRTKWCNLFDLLPWPEDWARRVS